MRLDLMGDVHEAHIRRNPQDNPFERGHIVVTGAEVGEQGHDRHKWILPKNRHQCRTSRLPEQPRTHGGRKASWTTARVDSPAVGTGRHQCCHAAVRSQRTSDPRRDAVLAVARETAYIVRPWPAR